MDHMHTIHKPPNWSSLYHLNLLKIRIKSFLYYYKPVIQLFCNFTHQCIRTLDLVVLLLLVCKFDSIFFSFIIVTVKMCDYIFAFFFLFSSLFFFVWIHSFWLDVVLNVCFVHVIYSYVGCHALCVTYIFSAFFVAIKMPFNFKQTKDIFKKNLSSWKKAVVRVAYEWAWAH